MIVWKEHFDKSAAISFPPPKAGTFKLNPLAGAFSDCVVPAGRLGSFERPGGHRVFNGGGGWGGPPPPSRPCPPHVGQSPPSTFTLHSLI